MEILNKLKSIIEGTEYENKVYITGATAREFILGKKLSNPINISVDYGNGNGDIAFVNWIRTKFLGYYINDGVLTTRIVNYLGYDLFCVSRKDFLVYSDFYCNSLLYNLSTGDIEDVTGLGMEHCYNKIIKVVNLGSIDTYHILDAIILHCEDDFSLDYLGRAEFTWKTGLTRGYLNKVFTRILMSPKPLDGIKYLKEFGILKLFSEDLLNTWDFNQLSKYHSLSLSDHLLSALNKVSGSKYGSDIRLRLAALFHDISKYRNYTFDGVNRHYKGHENFSAELAEKNLIKLGYDSSIISDVKILIKNHMRLKNNYDSKEEKFVGSDKQVRGFYRSLGELSELELELIDADNMSHAPKYCMPNQVKSFRERWDNIKSNFRKVKINGNNIIDLLGIIKGKSIGEVKQRILDLSDEFPGLDEVSLIRKFEELYKDKEFFLVKQDDRFFISLVDLKFDNTFFAWYMINPDCEYSLLEVSDKDSRYKDMYRCDKKVLKALEFPYFYDMLVKDHEVRVILNDVSSKLSGLRQYIGFKRVEINMSSNYSATVKWSDGSCTEML